MIVALHTAKKGCQLFILDTEFMDKDMDMECVLTFGQCHLLLLLFIYGPSGHVMPGQGATDRWVHHGQFFPRAVI